MKTKMKLPIADGQPRLRRGDLPIEFGVVRARPSSIENRKSKIENGFTLVELLTVIAVIAIIAAMIFPVSRSVRRQTIIHSAQAQMAQLQTALERYKSVYGFYPPASAWALTNQLYYELEGTFTTNISGAPAYMTLDHISSIPAGQVSTVFGGGVGGFMNCKQ